MFILNILKQTPLYAWVILAYILFIGFSATKNRSIWLPKLFIIPALLALLKYKMLVNMHMIITLLSWALGTLIGFIVGYKTKIKIIQKTWTIELPGNYHTLFFFLLFFSLKYTLGFLQATSPDFIPLLSKIDTILTFLFSGYAFGKATVYTWKYLKN